MNLVGTLAKVAIGVMVSRGVGKMMGGGNSGGNSGGGLGGLLGGLMSGGSGGGSAAGGLAGMLGGALSGGGSGSQGGLGGLLNSLGGGQGGGQADGMGGLGGLLNSALGGQSTPAPSAQENTQAEIMLRGMINAAKSDGSIDESEQKKILAHLGEVTQDEIDFVRAEMQAPLDLDGFIRSIPQGLEQQVYVMSLLGIDLDSQAEAQYLDKLAQGLSINHQTANQIHEKVGVPVIYG